MSPPFIQVPDNPNRFTFKSVSSGLGTNESSSYFEDTSDHDSDSAEEPVTDGSEEPSTPQGICCIHECILSRAIMWLFLYSFRFSFPTRIVCSFISLFPLPLPSLPLRSAFSFLSFVIPTILLCSILFSN